MHPTPSEAKANMEHASKEVMVRVQGEQPRAVQVPAMRNTRPVAEGDELVVLALEEPVPAPPAKKARIGEPSKAAAKGKAKAKGKGAK